MQGWNIDPKTGDYVMDGGAPEQTNSLKLPAYYRLKTKRLSWMYAPDNQYGSDYYTVAKKTKGTNQLLENIGSRALQPLIDDGRALDIELTAETKDRNSSELECRIVDSSGEVIVETFRGLGV